MYLRSENNGVGQAQVKHVQIERKEEKKFDKDYKIRDFNIPLKFA